MTTEEMAFDEQLGNRAKKRPWMDQKTFILGTSDNTDEIIDKCIA
jgi:hypothetical protein